jgi:hypothetical protein
MNIVAELFGRHAGGRRDNWNKIVKDQKCPYLDKKCYKVRKSDPGVSIGTCTVLYGRPLAPLIICPARLIERRRIFTDCLHLLTTHEPGNELHLVSEVSIPGGSVDYFLVSAKNGKVRDFVGIELQALDTTGSIWRERQQLLIQLEVLREEISGEGNKAFGINWKMGAKTILVQLHHKIQTFEHVHKKLVLVVQDKLLDYMSREFNFAHLKNPALGGDSMHFHSYQLEGQADKRFKLSMSSRLSTDADGVGACLGLQAEARIELRQILEALQEKISPSTIFEPF